MLPSLLKLSRPGRCFVHRQLLASAAACDIHALQAAAAIVHVASHPIWQAPSVRAHYQQRHALLTRVLRGEHSTIELSFQIGEEEQLVSSDFTQRAVRTGGQLLVYGISSAGLPQRWPLPQVPSDWTRCTTWAWWNQHLMLPYGRVFILEGEPDDFDREESGLVFLDTQTGSTSIVRLPEQDDFDDQFVRVQACSGAGLVLVEHFDEQQELILSVFQSSGASATSTRCPSEVLCSVSWSQGGEAITFWDEQSLWVWDLSAAPVQIQTLTTSPETAWAVPYTSNLVMRLLSSSSGSSDSSEIACSGAVGHTSLATSSGRRHHSSVEVSSQSDIVP